MTGRAWSSRPNSRLAAAFAREEDAGLAFALWGRLGVLATLAAWVVSTLPLARSGLYLTVIAMFATLGLVPYLVRRYGMRSHWLVMGFLTLDVALLSYLLIVPTDLFSGEWTPQLNLRLPNFLYLGVFLVGMALSYSPVLVIWTGLAAVAAWSAGVIWVVSLPDTIAYTSVEMLDSGRFTPAERIGQFLDPDHVSVTTWYNQVIFLLLITFILTLAVWRARRLVERQVSSEAARANLSRYFSPNIVDQLADAEDPLGRVGSQRVAVLFVDMIGFTTVSERLAPEQVVALLRSFHRRMAEVVFRHGGTIDKYIGDAVMATFGTPEPGPQDATRALACAQDMIAVVAHWNRKRRQRGAAAMRIGVGIHYGDVVVGNIGDARRLEFTVIGDVVNVASRLERLTRTLHASIVISADLMAAATREAGARPPAADQFVPEVSEIRGRAGPVEILVRHPDAETAL